MEHIPAHLTLYGMLYEKIKSPMSKSELYAMLDCVYAAYKCAGETTDFVKLMEVPRAHDCPLNLEILEKYRREKLGINLQLEKVEKIIEERKMIKKSGVDPELGDEYQMGSPFGDSLEKLSEAELIEIIKKHL